MLTVKILSSKSRVRYSVRRIVEAAWNSLRTEHPGQDLTIIEITDLEKILEYTPVLMAPALVINEKLVYDLWIPCKEQVVGWLRDALERGDTL